MTAVGLERTPVSKETTYEGLNSSYRNDRRRSRTSLSRAATPGNIAQRRRSLRRDRPYSATSSG